MQSSAQITATTPDPRSLRVRQPGLGLLPAGMERYTVAPLGVLALPLFGGDRVEILDPQGLQVAHVAAFNSQNACVTPSLGVRATATGERLAQCLARPQPGARRLGEKLRQLGIDLASCQVAELLSGKTRAGDSWVLNCEVDALCLIGAPGDEFMVDADLRYGTGANLPATELVVRVNRAQTGVDAQVMPLPEPLADPKAEIRVHKRTAVAYKVAAGDYIQVLDVEGRQCSDFQCFDLAKLERGVERCLDATTTRALMGAAYPKPGLFSKFYDVDFEPLVEIVQDTCGRHDSFGLACTDKYYDDAGYPGHVNCSDNFNLALATHQVQPRKGWMAMNIFFNTFFDDDYQFAFHEPWSRPGDYVLMRALKDMVCVSSACPCDIDPANGWNPTDIHLRIYPRRNLFKRAVAFRKTTDSEPIMTQQTSFHSRTSALTRDFSEYNGYWLANSFTNLGDIAEYWACRENVIITDLSPLRKAEVVGPDAEVLLQTAVTRDIRRLSPGQVVYTAMCNPSGGMIDDGTVFRLGKDNLRWVGGSDNSILQLREIAKTRNLQAWVKDSTAELHNLQVQGPRSLEVLQKMIWTRPDQANVTELNWFRFSIARVGDSQGMPILVSRTGYTGERGYEIFCHPKHAESVWDAVWQAGEEFGIKPLGLAALDLLRIEAGLIFAGAEFDEQTDPFEAGIGFTVSLKTKKDDFIGAEALAQRQANPQRKLVGLILQGEDPAAHGDGVYLNRSQVGVVTSGMVSPILTQNIALARLNVEYADLGSRLEVGKLDGHQKRIPCEVVAFPHFDPSKSRVKGDSE